jgi:hypothetical protein
MEEEWGNKKEILIGVEFIAIVSYWTPVMCWISYWTTQHPTSASWSILLNVFCQLPILKSPIVLLEKEVEREKRGERERERESVSKVPFHFNWDDSSL